MPRSKRTIIRDSVFRHSSRPAIPQGVSQESSPTRQTAVWLSDEEMEWLDAHAAAIKRAGWRGITRSAFIRALIQAARTKGLEVAGATGEADLAERIRHALDSEEKTT